MQAVCNSNALGGNILFARGHGRDYMMRSEKRTGYGSGPSTGGNPRPPKRRRKKAGFFYLLLTLILSVILWPVGMIMLWRRKVRWRITSKLFTSIITLVLCITLYGFGLTVQTDDPTVTKVQDSINDFLDVSADYVAEGYTVVCDKAVEVWDSAVDLGDAAGRAAMTYLADGIDLGVEYVGKGKEAVMALLPAEDDATEATQAPANSEEPSVSEDPEITDEPEASAEPLNSEEAAITDGPENSIEPMNSEEPQGELPLTVPDVTPDPESATAIGNGSLSLTGEFTETSDEPINSEEPEIGEDPENSVEPRNSEEPPADTASETSDEPTNSEEPEITAEPESSIEPRNSEEPPADIISETSNEPKNSEEPEITAEPADVQEPINSEEPAEPTATPVIDPDLMPKPAGEAVVYYNSNGVNYHMRSSCKNMRTASAGTLADAVEKGLTKCRNCGTPDGSILEAENAVWVDEEHRFHLSDDCADFSGEWSLMIVDDALAEGYMPCAACKAGLYVAACGLSIPAPTAEPTVEPTATPEPEPETVKPAMDLKPAGEAIVYHTSNGGWYHTIDNCSNMTGGKPYALADCVDNFKRCRKCEAPLPELVDEHCLWMDEEDECHTTDDCPGFDGKYTLVIRDDALAAGYDGCVMCGADEYLIPNTIVEYPEN